MPALASLTYSVEVEFVVLDCGYLISVADLKKTVNDLQEVLRNAAEEDDEEGEEEEEEDDEEDKDLWPGFQGRCPHCRSQRETLDAKVAVRVPATALTPNINILIAQWIERLRKLEIDATSAIVEDAKAIASCREAFRASHEVQDRLVRLTLIEEQLDALLRKASASSSAAAASSSSSSSSSS